MEQKLKEFKSRRRREYIMNAPKNFFSSLVGKFFNKKPIENFESEKDAADISIKKDSRVNNPQITDCDEQCDLSMPSSNDSILLEPTSWLTFVLYFLYILLWVIFYLIAIQLEFGFVYFVISGLLFIYFNTRTRPKKQGEISAYSVFNPGCEAIQGTLKAEHLERQFNLIQHAKTSAD